MPEPDSIQPTRDTNGAPDPAGLGSTGPELRADSPSPAADPNTNPEQRPVRLPTDQVGRYRVLGEIGRGGMGAVLRSHDPELGRDLALKVMLGDCAGHPDVVQRFREEAQVGGQLQHPGVVPVYELGCSDDGRPYFTMKLVKGQTLAKLLKERTNPAQERPRFLKIFEQVCQAVAYAHAKDVIHRDLKPSNVMVGAFGEVQVMDWGLAKVLNAAPASTEEQATQRETATTTVSVVKVSRSDSGSAETQEGDVLGTPAYMPPEQALGEINRVDQRADVFSLGAILCEILTGGPPYVGAERIAVQRQARRAELGDALRRLDGCDADEEVVGLTRRCLSAEPDSRPRDAGEVVRAVEAYLAGVEERARQAEVERATAQARAEEAEQRTAAERKARRLTLGLAASGLLLVVAGGSGAWLWQTHRAEAAARQRRADDQVGTLLAEARQRLQRGWQDKDNDSGTLTEAVAKADKAAEIAHQGEASPDIQEQADMLLKESRAKADQARRNAALLAALLNVTAPRETGRYERGESGTMLAVAEPSVEEQCLEAFRRWDAQLDLDRMPLERLAAQIGEQPDAVVREIVAGLDTWMLDRRGRRPPGPSWQRLLQLIEKLDGEEDSRELRRLLVSGELEREVAVKALARRLMPASALVGVSPGKQAQRLRALAAAAKPGGPVLGLVTLARALEVVGEAREAERLLGAAVAAQPDQVGLWDARGKLLERQGPARRAEAIACYQAVRAVRPRLGVALGRALLGAGNAADAEAVFRDLRDRQPDNPELLYYLGNALYEQKKLGEAVAAYQKAIALKPDLAEAHNNLGNALVQQKKLIEAVAAYHKAIDLQPDVAEAHNNLGGALALQKQLGEAVTAYHKAIALKPDYAAAYYNLGLALYDQNKLGEAVAAYHKAIDLQPDVAEAHNNLGNALAAQKQLGEAVTAFQKAIDLKPDYADAYYNLGLALADQKQLAAAVAAYQKAIDLKPDAEAYNNLGNSLVQQKKLGEAVAALRKADQLLPNHPLIRGNLRQTQRWLELDKQLPAILAGKKKPGSPQEQVELALFCATFKDLPHTAVGFFTDAFRAEPKLADDLNARHRYNAACAAALAAAGKGNDAGKLDDKERARLRQQALDWLRAHLEVCTRFAEKADARQMVWQKLTYWQEDADLTSVRDEKALATLPEKERAAWQQLWADVAALRKKMENKK
jgi:serine/threonine-protein kinase